MKKEGRRKKFTLIHLISPEPGMNRKKEKRTGEKKRKGGKASERSLNLDFNADH